jgi:tetratricopeptide (TPR) repeat protein
MALRLIGNNLAADGLQSTTAESAPSAVELGLQARRLLAAGDLSGYERLFEQAGRADEAQRRYQAQVALLELGLHAGLHSSTAAVATRVYVAVAGAALTVLEQEPSEPIILNYAGIACYELWSLDGAQALFSAARRLDPGLTNVDRNLAQVAQRKRAGQRQTRPMHASVPGLTRRAKTVAARAGASSGLTISLCMIVRDEETMLPRCLAAAAPGVDEIIVVDTGSKDSTVEIARSFGARVIEHPWNGSFSDARNVSFEAATGDWLLYLDADEILVAEDALRLRALTGRTWREAFYLTETSYTGELGDGAAITNNALRIFRNRPSYRFEGRIHEQIAPTLPTYAPGRIEHTAIRVLHYGYLGSVRDAKEKFRRNVKLLRQQAAESTPTPFLHFNLGSEYAGAGDPASALAEFESAWRLLQDEGGITTCEFAPSLVVRLTQSLRACGHVGNAQSIAQQGLKLFPDLTDLVLEQAAIALALNEEREAVNLYHRCIELGDAPAKLGAMLGCGTYLPRLALAQLHLRHGEIESARTLLDWCIEHHPDFLGVAEPYATVLLATGRAPDDVVAEVERRLDGITPSIRRSLAKALRQAGATGAAEVQYRKGLTGEATDPSARLALAEILLARGAYAEAAEQSALVPEDDPHSGLALRIEIFARVGSDDPTGAREALARAGTVGLPTAEREVFLGWIAITEGGAPPQRLSTAGVPLLGVIMDTLLAAGDLARFEALLPVLEQSHLSPRDQHELRAGMYLRHGLPARAASEWMAVCSDEPDVEALLGLAQVAAGQGMADDARTFAEGALELDPESETAATMLAQLQTMRVPVTAA